MNNPLFVQRNLRSKKQLEEIIRLNPKNTILLTTYQSHLKDQTLFAISQWFMGQSVECDREEYPMWKRIHNQELKQKVIPSDNPYLQILERQDQRIITFSMKEWKSITSKSQNQLNKFDPEVFISKLMILNNITRWLSSQKQYSTKCYALFEYDRKNPVSDNIVLEEMKKYINVSEMGTISISYRGAENSHGNSIKIKEKDWRYPCSQQIFDFENQPEKIQIGCLSLLNTNDKKGIVKNWLLKQSKNLEQVLTQFMCVVVNIIKERNNSDMAFDRSIYNPPENQKQNPPSGNRISQQALKLTYNEFIFKNNVKGVVPETNSQIESYYDRVKAKYDNSWDSHYIIASKQLAHLYFLCDVRIIFNYFTEHESLPKLKNMFLNIICLLSDLSPMMKIELYDLENVKVFLQLLIDEIMLFKDTSTLSWATRKIKENTNRILPNNDKVFQLLLGIRPQKNQQLNYYQDFQYLIKSNYVQKDLKSSQTKQTESKKYYREMEIKMYKAQKIYSTENVGAKLRAEAIESMFYIYENKGKLIPEYQQQFNFNKILKTCAQQLRKIGRSDLALKIYQKLKYIYMAQDSLKQFVHTLQEQDKPKEYLKFSSYLESMGYKELSMKYSQQAYEIDEGYAENMAKSKINSLISSKNESVKELEALQLLKSNRSSSKEYLEKGYEFDVYFKSSMSSLKETVSQSDDEFTVVFKDGVLFEKVKQILEK